MKRNIFMMAAVAILAMACTKEQQPASESQNNSEKVFLYASVEKTKAVVDHDETGAQKGTVTFEAGDKMSVWFQTGTETTGEGEKMTETPVGKVVEFTYESEDAAGLKFSADASLIPEEFTLVKAAYPAGSLNSKGVFSLIRDYTYDPDSMPIYVRADEVIMNENGTLSADLVHNASVFKFTLGDIPAYAAGFVLESQRYAKDAENNPIKDDPAGDPIKITTKFPYKTGYSEDITLYSVAAHSSYLTRVYLIDGDGDEIEGSERKFKQSWNDVSKNDFIIMPRIDFNKAELRKDFVKVCGVKWAKGNLQYKDGAGQDGFQTGWRIAPDQWHNFKYVDASADVPTRYDYTNANGEFEHFNLGGLGRFAKYYSGNIMPAAPMEISGKVYSKIDGSVELSGDDRFGYNPDKASYWGDIAFWASMGKYRMPTNAEMKNIHNVSDKLLGWYVTPDGKKVWGTLFRTPNPKRSTNSKPEMQFTDADLESGLFLPNAGRRANKNSGSVIAVTTQGTYRTGSYISSKTVSDVLRYYASYFHAEFNTSEGVVTGGSVKLYDGKLGTMGDAFDSTAGFLLRPVIAE